MRHLPDHEGWCVKGRGRVLRASHPRQSSPAGSGFARCLRRGWWAPGLEDEHCEGVCRVAVRRCHLACTHLDPAVSCRAAAPRSRGSQSHGAAGAPRCPLALAAVINVCFRLLWSREGRGSYDELCDPAPQPFNGVVRTELLFDCGREGPDVKQHRSPRRHDEATCAFNY